jgi:hypothetical protein
MLIGVEMSEHNRKPGNGAQIKRCNGRSYSFYLIEPSENANADNMAEKLITLKDVIEVNVTDGDYGFIVKAKLPKDNKHDAAYNYLSKRLGSNFGRVTSYYQYTK